MCRQQVMRAIGLLSRFSFAIAVAVSAGAIPPPITPPVVHEVTPSIGRPSGGQTVRIRGSRFAPPVRVLFGAAEGTVISMSETHIDVITPAVFLPTGAQQLVSDVTVIAGDHRVVAANAFTFRNENLTPRVDTLTPNRGSVRGGTRVTIFGDGFQQPVQVLFIGTKIAEARVYNASFNEILVETPPAEAVGLGAGEPVDVLVRNIHSQTETTVRGAFRYRPALAVTAISPNAGPATGGTDLRISGTGFSAPVAVNVAGVPAQVIALTGTEIRVRTTPGQIHDCRDRTGPVEVIDIVSGELGTGPEFTYAVQPVQIVDVEPRVTAPGTDIELTLANAAGVSAVTVTLGNLVSFRTAVVDSRARVTIPRGMRFPEESLCKPQAVTFDVRVTDETGCTTVLPAALTVTPPKPEGCAIISRARP